MAEVSDLVQEHLDYTRNMTFREKVLVWLRDNTSDYVAQTKEERWELMKNDLEVRGERKANEKRGAYIDQIARRCREDIPVIYDLMLYELNNNIDLADYIDAVETEDHKE